MGSNGPFLREFFTPDGRHRLLLVALRPDESSAIYMVEGPPEALYPVSRDGQQLDAQPTYVGVRFVEVGPGLVGPSLLDGDFRMSFASWRDVLMWPGELRLRNRDED